MFSIEAYGAGNFWPYIAFSYIDYVSHVEAHDAINIYFNPKSNKVAWCLACKTLHAKPSYSVILYAKH